MTKTEIRQQLKNEALNKIIEIYKSPNLENGKGLNSERWDDSWAEQRDDLVIDIIFNLLKQLKQHD